MSSSDKGHSQILIGLFGLSAATLVTAATILLSGLDLPGLPAAAVIGGSLAGLALIYGFFVPDLQALKWACALLLALHLILGILIGLGVLPPQPSKQPTPTPIAGGTVTLTPTASRLPEAAATVTLERQPTPSATAAILATTIPTPVDTPVVRRTPKPSTATPTRLTSAAPQLLFPEDGHSFSSQEPVTLRWETISVLESGNHYLLFLGHGCGENWVVLNEVQWQPREWKPEEVFWLRDSCQPKDGKYVWWVAVCPDANPGEYNTQPCKPVSPTSEVRSFAWVMSATSEPAAPNTPGVITPES